MVDTEVDWQASSVALLGVRPNLTWMQYQTSCFRYSTVLSPTTRAKTGLDAPQLASSLVRQVTDVSLQATLRRKVEEEEAHSDLCPNRFKTWPPILNLGAPSFIEQTRREKPPFHYAAVTGSVSRIPLCLCLKEYIDGVWQRTLASIYERISRGSWERGIFSQFL